MKKSIFLSAILGLSLSASAQAAWAPKSACEVNTTKLKAIFESFLNEDVGFFMEALTDDVVWQVETTTLPWAGVYTGKAGEQGLEGFFGKVLSNAEIKNYVVDQFTCDETNRRVVVQGAETIKSLKNGQESAFNNIEVWQFNAEGKITNVHIYFDTAHVSKVLGL